MPVSPYIPTADTQSDWTPDSGGNNFSRVDDDQRDTATNNNTATQTDRDLFTGANLNIPNDATIAEVLIKAWMKKDAAQQTKMGLSWKFDLTTQNKASIDPPDTNYLLFSSDIISGRSWIPADFDGQQFSVGYYHDQAQARTARASMSWAEVRWTPIQPTRSPGTTVNDAGHGTHAWANPNNAQTSNDTYSVSAIGVAAISNYHKSTNFGFTIGEIPDDHTINGVEVWAEISEGNAAGTLVQVESVRLVKGGTIQGDEKSTGSSITGRDTSFKSGSPTDLHGLTLTPADVRNSGFGVAIAVEQPAGSVASSTQLDNIVIVIHSAPSTGMPGHIIRIY